MQATDPANATAGPIQSTLDKLRRRRSRLRLHAVSPNRVSAASPNELAQPLARRSLAPPAPAGQSARRLPPGAATEYRRWIMPSAAATDCPHEVARTRLLPWSCRHDVTDATSPTRRHRRDVADTTSQRRGAMERSRRSACADRRDHGRPGHGLLPHRERATRRLSVRFGRRSIRMFGLTGSLSPDLYAGTNDCLTISCRRDRRLTGRGLGRHP
ncbi:hypothetical protein SAMN05216551_1093 [Chitinasiproducens palmae]|uniref:Uncharacterized protein n=1 Tax=Chitinasiproducens palmae TaxID=1770053 RepID=A0A1H2PRR8_9BURK|nr:hypothetical protein SAMN05216551_1093 [Chitinasiproducens palmae]